MDNAYHLVQLLQNQFQFAFDAWALSAIQIIAYYFFLINAFYMFLLILAFLSIRKRKAVLPYVRQLDSLGYAPSITILAPAFNEERTIVDSVQALCHLKYSNFNIIIINDGSRDLTLNQLIENFSLEPTHLPRWSELSRGSLQGAYQSKTYENLFVLDKVNTGKADSLNCGVDYASTDLVCCVDSDSLLEPTALAAITAPFLEDPTTIASGGTIRVVNGSQVHHAQVVQRTFPKDFLGRIQWLEYIRAFFCGRVGWNYLNSTLIISGAFGAFRKSAMVNIGGYHDASLGEDMDLVVRLHAYHLERNIPYRIVFLPEPVCWTEAPSDWSTLKRQRVRWSIGLFQVLWRARRLFLRPRYKKIGLVALPYFLIVDLLSPLLEIAAILLIIVGLTLGLFSFSEEVLLFFVSLAYGSVVTFAAATIDDSYDVDREEGPSLWKIFLYSLFENFGYRQIHALWRVEGIIKGYKRNNAWGLMVRKGVSNPPPSSIKNS